MAPLSRQLLANLAVHDVVVGGRLRECGVSYEAVRHAVATERLFRQYRGVYSLTPDLTDKGRWFAAVAASGPAAALSHMSAARLWTLTSVVDHVIETTVPSSNGRRPPPGLQVHRTRRPDSTRRDRIEVTTLHRTIDDCAPRLGRDGLHRMLRQAEFHHRLDVVGLTRRARSRALKRLLGAYVAGAGIEANELEARFYALCATAGLPLPQRQRWLGARRVDFVWPELGLVVECDGRDAHARTLAYQDDAKVVVADLQAFLAPGPRVEA